MLFLDKKMLFYSLIYMLILIFFFTQMLRMTISWPSLSLIILGPRSRSQWLFLEKHCRRSSHFTWGEGVHMVLAVSLSTYITLPSTVFVSPTPPTVFNAGI